MSFVRRDAKRSSIKILPSMRKLVPALLVLLALFLLLIIFLAINTLQKNTTRNNSKKSSDLFARQVISVDDDPVMGDRNAPLTLVEFSDFECGNCKLFFLQTLPLLKEKYINTGKLRFVYRDFPVKSHDPLATQEATAADCAREQKQDEGYFDYHDGIFNTTTSGGRGLEVAQLFLIASNLKLDQMRFKECFESERFKEEVKKDFFDGMNSGITGTPTFFLGLTTQDNTIKGMKILGAMPYAAFKIIIEELLESNETNN